jgi:soluble lytic murein transglycosylase-like protein
MAIPFLSCMVLVASFNALPPRVLPSIQAVEGGRIDTVHADADGSQDLGLMQINTTWLPALARVTRQDPLAVRARLLTDGCFNIAAAGAILRLYLNETHNALLPAIGYYHSHTPALGQAYQLQVLGAARAMFAPGRR